MYTVCEPHIHRMSPLIYNGTSQCQRSTSGAFSIGITVNEQPLASTPATTPRNKQYLPRHTYPQVTKKRNCTVWTANMWQVCGRLLLLQQLERPTRKKKGGVSHSLLG